MCLIHIPKSKKSFRISNETKKIYDDINQTICVFLFTIVNYRRAYINKERTLAH